MAQLSVVVSSCGPSVICTRWAVALPGFWSSATSRFGVLRPHAAANTRVTKTCFFISGLDSQKAAGANRATPFRPVGATPIAVLLVAWRQGRFSNHRGQAQTRRCNRDEPIRQRLQESDELVFFCVGQTEIADRQVLVVLLFRHRPAGYLLYRAFRAMPRQDRESVFVTRVVEMHDFLQAQEIPVVHVGFYKDAGGVRRGRYLSGIA